MVFEEAYRPIRLAGAKIPAEESTCWVRLGVMSDVID
jgi:hypothetical protein